MKQVKLKPWICEHWAANGWDGTTDVYRLEFSLRPDTRGIAVVNEDGEIENVFHFKDLSMLENIDKVYRHCFNKHFNFVRAERTAKGNYRKQSRCTSVRLFKSMPMASCTIQLSNKKDSGRSAKIFAKKLMQLNNELRGTDFDLAIAGNELMTYIIKIHNLEEWQRKKMPDITYSDRIEQLVTRGRNSKLSMDVMKLSQMPKLFKSAVQQAADLRNTELDIKRNELQIQPDGKIPTFDTQGNIISYVNPMF